MTASLKAQTPSDSVTLDKEGFIYAMQELANCQKELKQKKQLVDLFEQKLENQKLLGIITENDYYQLLEDLKKINRQLFWSRIKTPLFSTLTATTAFLTAKTIYE